MKTAIPTRTLVLTALMLYLGVAGAYAQQKPVKMTFSGTNVATTINLQANTVTDETHLAGGGSLGPFTFRELHADGAAAAAPSGCTGPYFGVLKGAGVFQFLDESLLIVTVTGGSGCVNRAAGTAGLIVNYQVNGGTGRFTGASGSITMSATIMPILANAAGAPAFLTNTGTFEGTVIRAARGDGQDEDEQ